MDRNDLHDSSAQRPSNVPTRHLTTAELEAVIQRAVELQAGHSARSDEGVSEDDVVRIGQELGLGAAAVRRAIAEVLLLIGVPVMGGAWFGMRAIYRSISRSTEEKLESLLDRLEHNELV